MRYCQICSWRGAHFLSLRLLDIIISAERGELRQVHLSVAVRLREGNGMFTNLQTAAIGTSGLTVRVSRAA